MRDHQSPLEVALVDVNATLTELLAAADAQYEAVVERDRERLEGVTRLQERLAVRLERAEQRRTAALGDQPLSVAVATQPHLATLAHQISTAVRELQARNARTQNLLEQAAQLNAQTVQFLQRLVGVSAPAYSARGATASRQSVLLDSRA